MTEPRRPLHIPIVVGISAGLYAASLAAVTGLQSAHDVATAAAAAPGADTAALLRSSHDQLDAELARARAAYTAAADHYDALTKQLAGLETRLAGLAAQADSLRSAPLAVPGAAAIAVGQGGIVVHRGTAAAVGAAPAAAAAPAVHATTGASGAPPP